MTKMDGHLDGMEGVFNKYKNKMKENEDSFERFRAASKRRRLLKKNMEAKIGDMVAQLVEALAGTVDVGTGDLDADEAALFKTLRDTFVPFHGFILN